MIAFKTTDSYSFIIQLIFDLVLRGIAGQNQSLLGRFYQTQGM
jgi:hypothetical protein